MDSTFQELSGRYQPPAVAIGDECTCLRSGPVRVYRFDGPANWPKALVAGSYLLRPVVTDSLLSALAIERSSALAGWLNVSESQISYLRRHFGIMRPGPQGRVLSEQVKQRGDLVGSYEVPKLNVGDSAECLLYGPVVIAGALGPIAWPATRKSYRNLALLVTEELLKALRTESNIAFAYWFGISTTHCSRLRRHFGISGWTPGSVSHRKSSKGENWMLLSDWTKEMISRLGTDTDANVAKTLGVCRTAVTRKRLELGIRISIPVTCPECKTVFTVEYPGRKFCSRSCYKQASRRITQRIWQLGMLANMEEKLNGILVDPSRVAAATG